MVVNVTKISQKRKNKNLLSTENNIMEWERMSYDDYKKVIQFSKFCFLIRKSTNIFWSWKVTSWSIRNFRFLKYKDFFGVSISRKLGAFLKKYKKLFQCRGFSERLCGPRPKNEGFHFRKYKKNFLLRKYKKFFRAGLLGKIMSVEARECTR